MEERTDRGLKLARDMIRVLNSKGKTYKNIANDLGGTEGQIKKIMSGSTKRLNAEILLSLLDRPDISPEELAGVVRYRNLWQQYQEAEKKRDSVIEDNAVSEYEVIPIQDSLEGTDNNDTITESARRFMSLMGWCVGRGHVVGEWIYRRIRDKDKFRLHPIAPSFTVATIAMQKMGWLTQYDSSGIWRRENGTRNESIGTWWISGQAHGMVEYSEVNSSSEKAAKLLRDKIIKLYQTGYFSERDVPTDFRDAVEGKTVGEVESRATNQFHDLLEKTVSFLEHYEMSHIPEEDNKYSVITNKYQYLEGLIFSCYDEHSSLVVTATDLADPNEQLYAKIWTKRYSDLVIPLLTVNDPFKAIWEKVSDQTSVKHHEKDPLMDLMQTLPKYSAKTMTQYRIKYENNIKAGEMSHHMLR